MRIDRLELRLCRLPLVSFFETSFGRSYDRSFLLIRLTGEGHEGWGEAVAEANPYYSSETTETAWHIITGFLAPRLLSVKEPARPFTGSLGSRMAASSRDEDRNLLDPALSTLPGSPLFPGRPAAVRKSADGTRWRSGRQAPRKTTRRPSTRQGTVNSRRRASG